MEPPTFASPDATPAAPHRPRARGIPQRETPPGDAAAERVPPGDAAAERLTLDHAPAQDVLAAAALPRAPLHRAAPDGQAAGLLRWTRLAAAPLLAGALVGAWWIVAPRTPDLAGQSYRVWLFSHHGFLLWDNNWYAGHHIPGYSLIFPALASLIGMHALGALAVVCSSLIFSVLLRRAYARGTLAAELFFALAAAGDAWIGRLTFALGVTLALASTLALLRSTRAAGTRSGRSWRAIASLCAALSGACSPVSGLLLVLAAVSWSVAALWERGARVREAPGGPGSRRSRPGLPGGVVLHGESASGWGALLSARRLVARRLRSTLPLLGPPLVVVVAMQALFPEGGYEPYGSGSLSAALAVTLAFLLALPREERTLLVGGAIYLVVDLLSMLPTPMGSNSQRYGVLLAGPLLLCALFAHRRSEANPCEAVHPQVGGDHPDVGGDHPDVGGDHPDVGGDHPHAADDHAQAGGKRAEWGAMASGWRRSPLPGFALVGVIAGIACWVVWGPVVQTREVMGDPSTQASYYAPLVRFLHSRSRAPMRIEVPFTRAHWEANWLARDFPLARGWERQLDKRYNEVLESSALTPRVYRAWLLRNGVSYVALPDVPFDESSFQEVRLIRGGLPFLREELRSSHWRVFRVLGAAPLVAPLPAPTPRVGRIQGAPRGRAAAPVARLSALGRESFALDVIRPGRFVVKVHYTPYWTVTQGVATVEHGPEGFTEVRTPRAGVVEVAARFSARGAFSAVGELFGLA